MMMKAQTPRQKQSGVMLLEALIAILIFAVGILGIVGLQGTAVKQVTDARFRSDAALLANQLIGTMWIGDRAVATLQANFTTGNTGYNSWQDTVALNLPVPTGSPPTVDVDNAGIVTITIYWSAPSEPAGTTPHKYVAIAQIK